MCDNCIINLNTSYNFKHLCESSDIRLRNLLSQQLSIKDVSEDVEEDQTLVLSQYIIKDESRNIQQDINLDFDDINVIKITYANDDIKLNSNQINEVSVQTQSSKPQNEHKLKRTIKPRKKKVKLKEKILKNDTKSCERCNDVFEEQDLLDEHKKICLIETEKIICNVCHKVFKDKYILSRHSKLHHGNNCSYKTTIYDIKIIYRNFCTISTFSIFHM